MNPSTKLLLRSYAELIAADESDTLYSCCLIDDSITNWKLLFHAEGYKHTYPELKDKQKHIEQTILSEEKSFLATLEKGIIQFEKIIKNSSSDTIIGSDAFKLYDTYGFPLDLTELMASEKGKIVDSEGFESEMKKQKELAKKNQKFVMDPSISINSYLENSSKDSNTEIKIDKFIRYELGE